MHGVCSNQVIIAEIESKEATMSFTEYMLDYI